MPIASNSGDPLCGPVARYRRPERNMYCSINPTLLIEDFEGEFLVCDVDLGVVHRLSGRAAEVVKLVLGAQPDPAEVTEKEILDVLLGAKVLIPFETEQRELFSSRSGGVSRRQLVGLGITAMAVGVTTLALPEAAAAASITSAAATTTTTIVEWVPVESPTTTTTTPATTTTTTQPLTITGDATTISGTGVFTDSTNGTTFTRSALDTKSKSGSANWNSMSVTYVNASSQTVTNTIEKTISNGSTVGVLTKVSNTDVTINLSSGTSFTLTIVYNGGKTITYTFNAVP